MSSRPLTTALYKRLQTQVHVWFCQPPAISDAQKLAEYKAVLSEQELARYQRFHYEKDRHSYLVSHALLRFSLSKYAGLSAAQWQFACGEHGKPVLFSSSAPADLSFNLTHADGLSACVISADRRCGIDVENTHRKNKLAAVAQRMFADEELSQLAESNIVDRFYTFWTLREAYVKALGTGLAGSSKEFYFEVGQSDSSVSLHHRNDSAAAMQDWLFGLYQPTAVHVLAVGVESADKVQIEVNEFVP
jgi:4'-phosphopantetheinyl transferase